MSYVDGFVFAVPNENIDRYRDMAEKAGKVWMEYGALAYREYIADDLNSEMLPFQETVNAKDNETVMFAYILYNSRAHRDEVNKKVMSDPRMDDMCDKNNPPFDFKKMAYGGFRALVNLGN
jgi:uncharacterized protein YbaA (DUF1428 family)